MLFKKYLIGAAFLVFVAGAWVAFNSRESKAFTQSIESSGIPSEASGGGGVSWADYDGDGFQDLLARTNPGEEYRLYRNDGANFSDITVQAGLAIPHTANAGIFGDYDNDGCPDLFISNGYTLSEKGESDMLYHNNCDGTFTDVSVNAKITIRHHGKGAAWADYNNDGDIDIYVASYGHITFDKKPDSWTLAGFTYEPNILYRNNADGTFTNVAAEARVEGIPSCSRYVPDRPASDYMSSSTPLGPIPAKPFDGQKANWQPVWFDYDNDGNLDLYVSNEISINTLYHNDGGEFTDVTERAGLCHEHSTHGVAIGDFDGNGYQDLYVTGSRYNILWKNNGDGTFTEAARESDVANIGYLGWGTGAFDFDNDGALDLYSINGTTHNASSQHSYPDLTDTLYRGDGSGRFFEIGREAGVAGNYSKSNGAFADYNNDGFLDAFVLADEGFDAPASNMLYTGKPNSNHYLSVKLVGTKSNRDGIGASISATTNGMTQMRHVAAGASFLSQNSLVQIFGLGAEKTIDSLVVKWPSGITQELRDISADQLLTIIEEASR